MARWKKIVLFLSLFGALVFTGLLIAAHLLVTPERVRESIIPLVQKSLHRDLQLGEIDISLFSGIVISDLVLLDQQGAEPFVSIDKAILRYRLWPLLLMQVKVDELRLVRPHLELIRLADGSFNFSDMAVSPGKGPQPAAPAVSESGPPPFALHVSEIVITDGSVQMYDQPPGKSSRHAISSLNLVVRDFSLTEPFQAVASADWNSNSLTLEGVFDLDDRTIDTAIRLNSVQLEIKGDLLADAKGDRLRAEVKLPSILLTELIQSLPAGVVAIPELPALSGRLAAQFKLDGLLAEPQNLLRSGQLSFGNVMTTTPSIQAGINGTVQLEGPSLKGEHLSLKFNDQPLDMSLHIPDITTRPLSADVKFHSTRVDLNRFLPPDPQKNASATSAVSDKPAPEIGPYDLPVAVAGSIHIETLLYRDLPVQDLKCLFSLKDNRLTIEKLTSAVAGGSFEQSGTINLGIRGFRYAGATGLHNIQANPLVKALQPDLAESVFGVVAGQMTLNGAGTATATIKENLTGEGRFDLKQAKLSRMPALDSAADLLGVAELREIVIEDGQAVFHVNKGVVAVDLKTNGPQLRQATAGTVTLAGQLGLKVTLSLSPEITRKLDRRHTTGSLLLGKDGWSRIPLRVQGAYAAPRVSLDMAAVSKQAKESAVDSLAEKIKKKIGVDKQNEGTPSGDDSASKLIDGVLKGLLGN